MTCTQVKSLYLLSSFSTNLKNEEANRRDAQPGMEGVHVGDALLIVEVEHCDQSDDREDQSADVETSV